MNNSLYKCPICGGPTTFSSMIFQPQPCLHCRATLKTAEHGENHGTTLFDGGKDNETTTPRIVQLEAALRSIVNGDILTSREKAKMALEGTFPPVDEKPEQEAKSHGNVKDPFYFKGYWYQEYLEMREKFWKQIGENSKLAERIVQLRAALDAMVEGVARKTDSQQADRIRELEEHSSKQDFLIDELADSLRAMVAHCEGFISNLKEGK